MAKVYSVYTDLSTGETYTSFEDDGLPDIDEAALKRPSMKCSRLQGRIALGETACKFIDAMAEDPVTPWAMREAIRSSVEWQRASPTIDELGWLLGYDPEQMDDLFAVAMQISV